MLSNLEAAIVQNPLVALADATVLSAVQQMSELKMQGLNGGKGSTCVAIVSDGLKVLGILTQEDVMGLVSQQRPIGQLTLGQFWEQKYWEQQRSLSASLILSESDLGRFDHINAAIAYFESAQMTHLAIVDAQDQLIGILQHETLIRVRDNTLHEATAALFSIQQKIHERLAKAEPLKEVLVDLLQTMETYLLGSSCSITFCQDGRLGEVTTSSLPQEYAEAVQKANLPIEEGVGSCGTAAFRGELVVVSDIANDPLWQDYKNFALAYGLQACSSIPIFASDRTLLGAFGIYYRERKAPQAQELTWIAQAANIAGIAIERDRATQALHRLNQDLENRVQVRTQELQEREQFLKTVLDTFPLSVFWKDRNSVYLGCNQNFLDDTGFQTIAQIIGKTDYEMLCGETKAALYRADDRAVIESQTAKLGIVETQYQANGQIIWVETNKLPLRNLQGEVIGVLGTYQDISDRKNAELALQASEAKFRRITESVPGMIFRYVLHPDGRDEVLYVSPQVQQIYAVSPEAVLQDINCLWARFQPEDIPMIQSAIENSAVSLQPFFLEARLIFPEDRVKWIQVSSQPDRQDNGDVIWDGVVIEISDRKKAEQQLQKLSERLELALQSAQIGVWEYDYASDRLFMDDRMLAIYGISPEAFQGTYADWSNRVHPDDLLHAQPDTSNEQTICNSEFRIIRPDGTIRWIMSFSLRQRNPQGEVVRAVGMNLDISDRKQTELQLQRINEELVRATRLKDEFLANMSHELRTPLNAILGMTEILQEAIFGDLNDRQRQSIQTIEQSSNHLLELINDILDVAKIEAGQIKLLCQPCHIESLCQSSLIFIKQQAFSKNIQLETEIPANLPRINLDERRIRQVLINLLSNAVKFTPNGGQIALKVSYIAFLDETNSSDNGAMTCDIIEISITDTGIGIAPDQIKRLFQPFVQVESALNRSYSGTGLGLALVKRLVELHGGEVRLSSELGVGSCFTIALPVVPFYDNVAPEAETENLNPPDAIEPAIVDAPMILLAEDNDANISIFVEYLSLKGYPLVVAHNGKIAIELAQQTQPDLILMDIQMPEMDGLEAIQRIRQIPELAHTPIVAITALAMDGDCDRCLAAGANAYLSKPIKLKQLAQLIQELL